SVRAPRAVRYPRLGHLADRKRAADRSSLAALVGDARILDHGAGAGMERGDHRLIALFDHVPPKLARAGDFAVVRIEIVVQIDERAEPQRHRQAFIDMRQNGRNELGDFRLLRKVSVGRERDAALLRPMPTASRSMHTMAVSSSRPARSTATLRT